MASLLFCLQKTNTNSFILSRQYINNKHKLEWTKLKFLLTIMDYFLRKSLSKYLTDTIDFKKHDINIFINDKWRKYVGSDKATLQNLYKVTWTLLLTNKHKVTSLPESPSNVSPDRYLIRIIFWKLVILYEIYRKIWFIWLLLSTVSILRLSLMLVIIKVRQTGSDVDIWVWCVNNIMIVYIMLLSDISHFIYMIC